MGTSLNRRWFNVASAPGSGDIACGSALAGYLNLGAAHNGMTFNGVTFLDGSAWEVRNGCVYTHATATLTRGTLEESSAGSAISLSSSTTVMLSLSASTLTLLDIAMQSVAPGGRLTTESGVPVSTSDRTSQSTLYYTPFAHNTVPLWDGAQWKPVRFTDTSLALSGLTSGKPYDVFSYISSGVLALELLVWTNDTTRATAVTLQDGRYCKSGDKTRLLLGTIYTTGATTTADALASRYVWNLYNRVHRRCSVANSTSHSYTAGAWQEWNAGSGVSRLAFVSGAPLDALNLSMVGNLQRISTSGTIGYLNIAYDAADGSGNLVTNLEGYGSSSSLALSASATVAGPVGKHYATCVQYGVSSVTYAAYSLQGAFPC